MSDEKLDHMPMIDPTPTEEDLKKYNFKPLFEMPPLEEEPEDG